MSSGRLKMPILLRGCIGIGHSAATHHSGNYYSMFAHFPGLRVVVPSTPVRRQGAARRTPSAATTRCSSSNTASSSGSRGPCPRAMYEIAFGQAAVVREGTRRDGRRAGARWSIRRSRPARNWLREGISVELIDPRTVVAARRRDDPRIGRQDRPAADRGRGVRPVRHRRRDRRPARRPGLRRPRRADPPAQRRASRRRPTARRWKPPSSRIPRAIAQAIRDLVARMTSRFRETLHGDRDHHPPARLEHGRGRLRRLAQGTTANS